MAEFFQENVAGLFSMSVLAVWGFVQSILSIKSDIKSMDKMRQEKGIASMSDEEKSITRKVLRSSIITAAIGAFVAGLSSMIVFGLLV